MKRSILYITGASILALAAGCSNSTQPNSTPPNTNQVNYQKGNTYVYTQQTLDANTGMPTGIVDTVTSLVIDTGMSYQGMTNVTEIQNSHSNGASPDTTYIAQSGGNYWHYNYGLESLNTNQSVINYNNGKQIVAGWVLQAQLGAAPGTTWIAVNDSTLTVGSFHATLIDTAREMNDTTIMVRGTAVTAQHIVHTVDIKSLISATGPVDTYVSEKDGTVLDIVHPSSLANTAAPGRVTVLIRAQ